MLVENTITYSIDTVNHIPMNLLRKNVMRKLYFDYDKWIEKICTENRSVLVAKCGDLILGFAIFKIIGESLKVCQLYILPNYRKNGIGYTIIQRLEFFATDNGLQRLYITVNKNNYNTIQFLEKNNFQLINIAKYSDFVYEKALNANFARKYVLMSLKPKYWELMLSGHKKCELRKKAWGGNSSVIVVYASHPISKIVGVISTRKIHKISHEEIRKNYLEDISISDCDFERYANGHDELYLIFYDRVTQFSNQIELSNLDIKRPPQNYCYISEKQYKHILSIEEKSYDRLY